MKKTLIFLFKIILLILLYGCATEKGLQKQQADNIIENSKKELVIKKEQNFEMVIQNGHLSKG
jgi:hypothetical protein